jgi:5-methylcytosine-specific restriction endonuclease McrA
MVPTDWKPEPRIRDSAAIQRKVMSEPLCRACRLEKAVDGHHVLLKSQSGDDIEDNIVPLCRACHRDYHEARIGIRLTLDERLYVLTKLGQNPGTVYLENRRYA